MQSGDENNEHLGIENLKTESPTQLLKREAGLPGQNRNNWAWIAGICAFAGIGMGFGAGVGVGAMLQGSHCQHQARTVHINTPIQTRVVTRARVMQAPKVTWLGVKGHSINGQAGARILNVFPGSPAKHAGFAPGDIVLSVDNQPTNRFEDLKFIVSSHSQGDAVQIHYMDRHGVQKDTTVVLSSVSAESFANRSLQIIR